MSVKGISEKDIFAELGQDQETVSVNDLINRLFRRKFLIAFIGLVFAAMAFVVAFMPADKDARALVRIEPEISTAGELTNIDAEAETIASWSMVAQTVEAMQADVQITAQVDWIARMQLFLAKHKEKRSAGSSEVIRITEPSLLVSRINFPEELLNQKLFLVYQGENEYDLYGADNNLLLKGKVGSAAKSSAKNLEIEIAHITAPLGTKFTIIPRTKDYLINLYMSKLNAKQRGKNAMSGILDVSFSDRNPEFAEAFLNTLLKVYLDQAFNRSALGKMKALSHLEGQLSELTEKIRASESRLEKFKKEFQTVDLQTESKLLLQEIAKLSDEVNDITLKKNELQQIYTNDHPSIIAMSEQLKFLQGKLEESKGQVQRLPSIERKFFDLKHDAENYARLKMLTSDAIVKLRTEVEGITGYARLVNEAQIVPEQMILKILRLGILGFVFGVTISSIFVLLGSTPALSKLYAVSDVERITRLPVVAEIPHSPAERQCYKASNRNTILMLGGNDKALKSLQEMERKFDFITHGARNNVVAFTAPMPDQGTSFLALNFATLSAAHRKTILVDCDMVGSSLHQTLKSEKKPGLSDVVIGGANLLDCVKTITDDKLYYLPAGTRAPTHHLLLDRERIGNILDQLSKEYDCVVLDYPPMTFYFDYIAKLSHSGTIFHVMKQGLSSNAMREYLKPYEASSRIHMVILNDIQKIKKR